MTHRRDFLKTAVLGSAALVCAPAATLAAAPAGAAPGKLRGYPVLMNPAGDSVSVVWLTEGECAGVVEYGDAPDRLTNFAYGQAFGVAEVTRLHRVRLERLPAGRPVYYRVVTRNALRAKDNLDAGAVYSFVLPGPDAQELFFAAINDTHEKTAVVDTLLRRIEERQPAFLVWNGDIVDQVNGFEHLVRHLILPVDRPFAASLPVVITRGNHDARGAMATFPACIGMPDDRLYYSFRAGPAAFVVLDSCEDKADARLGARACFEPYLRRQTEWLAAELAKPHIRTAPVRIALFHIPFWSRNDWAGPEVRRQWLALLEKAGIHLLVCGHTHTHEFLRPGDDARHRTFDPDAPRVSLHQLTGGGPSPASARVMFLHASAEGIRADTENLERRVVSSHRIPVR